MFFEQGFLTPILKPVFYLVGGFPTCLPGSAIMGLASKRWPAGALDRQTIELKGVSNRTLSICLFLMAIPMPFRHGD